MKPFQAPLVSSPSGRAMRVPQSGFTLLELLFAMVIVLGVVVAVQRYVSSVLTDRTNLSAQQNQTNQINIILSNIQNDVARAGFVPVASVTSFTDKDLEEVAVKVRPCTGNNCEGNELWLAYWTHENPAHDCLGNRVMSARTSGWVRVENIYQFRKDGASAPLVLGCDGNGGSKGGNWAGLSNPTEGDIADFNWNLDSSTSEQGNKLLHVCLNTRTAKNNQVGKTQPQSCTTSKVLVGDDTWVYQTIQLDMLVRPTQMGVAP